MLRQHKLADASISWNIPSLLFIKSMDRPSGEKNTGSNTDGAGVSLFQCGGFSRENPLVGRHSFREVDNGKWRAAGLGGVSQLNVA